MCFGNAQFIQSATLKNLTLEKTVFVFSVCFLRVSFVSLALSLFCVAH